MFDILQISSYHAVVHFFCFGPCCEDCCYLAPDYDICIVAPTKTNPRRYIALTPWPEAVYFSVFAGGRIVHHNNESMNRKTMTVFIEKRSNYVE